MISFLWYHYHSCCLLYLSYCFLCSCCYACSRQLVFLWQQRKNHVEKNMMDTKDIKKSQSTIFYHRTNIHCFEIAYRCRISVKRAPLVQKDTVRFIEMSALWRVSFVKKFPSYRKKLSTVRFTSCPLY